MREEGVNKNKEKICNILRKTPVLESLSVLQLYSKQTPTQVFSSEYWKAFKSTFFSRTLAIAASGQTEKNFFALDQKEMKRSIESNLNRNAEAVSLRYFCKKGVLKNFIIFTGKHLCQGLSFDKVACVKTAIY